MSFFNKLKKHKVMSRIEDEEIYKQVINEISQGIKNEGVWGKALADSNGDYELAKSKYIKYRAQSIKDKTELLKSSIEDKLNEHNKIKNKIKSLFSSVILAVVFFIYIIFIVGMILSAISSKI